MRAPETTRRGLTLLEAVITTGIVGFMALVIMSANVPLSDVSAGSALALDMDQQARRFLVQLRRELRQSGFEPDGTPRVRVPSPGVLELYERVAPDGDPEPWRPQGARWAAPIRYELTGGRVVRTEGGVAVDVLANVTAVQYTLPAGSNTVLVTLTVTRRAPRATASGAPASVARTYREQVEMLNRPQQ